MKDKLDVKLKCVFCGSEDFSLPKKNYEPKVGDKIKCANCGRLNDYDALQNQAIEDVTKIFSPDIIDHVKIFNPNNSERSSDNTTDSLDNLEEEPKDFNRDDLDYELDEISDRLEELNEEEKDNGCFISDDLTILSDYFDLMDEGGLTKSEFMKYKTQCMRWLQTKKYISAPNVNAKALKFAHSLLKSGCITKDEYEMVKHRIELLPAEEKQREEEKRTRDLELFLEQEKAEADAREETERKEKLGYLYELLKLVLYILSIPLRIIWWFVEVAVFGYKDVWKRDEMERIMNKRHDD